MRIKTLAIILSLLSGALLSASIFLWIAAGEIYDYEDTFQATLDAPVTDVVLCLAGGKKRIAYATNLWFKIKQEDEAAHLKPPVLFLSGVGPKAGVETLIEQGVSRDLVSQLKKDEVVFENISENTFENAQLFAAFVRQNHWRNVVLVTAGYHMRRAQFILKKVLDPDVVVKTATVDAVHFDRNQWHQDAYAIRVTAMEYIKWLYYRYSY